MAKKPGPLARVPADISINSYESRIERTRLLCGYANYKTRSSAHVLWPIDMNANAEVRVKIGRQPRLTRPDPLGCDEKRGTPIDPIERIFPEARPEFHRHRVSIERVGNIVSINDFNEA